MNLLNEFKKTPEYLSFTQDQKNFSHEFFKGGFHHLNGDAGTGKSYVINTLFNFMERMGLSFSKTASTGVAAFNIGGSTLHSFFGLGLAEEDAAALCEKVAKNTKAAARIRAVSILLIDEISMVNGSLLDKVDIVMKYIRRSNKPFGGVKTVVAVGDFLQLAPVWKNDDVKQFAFQSRAWQEANFKNFTLTEIVRQGSDKAFAELLRRIRIGDVSDMSLLKSRFNAKFPDDGIKPVYIYCLNRDVDDFNKQELAKIKGETKTYIARFTGPDWYRDHFIKNCASPEVLTLKVGASVMITANIDQAAGFVNGTMGVVEGFSTNGPVIRTQVGTIVVETNTWEVKEQVTIAGKNVYRVVASMEQIPLRIAFALTTHRIQGLTLDRAILDMGKSFSSGMLYVALSRVRDLESVSLVEFPVEKITANPECLAFYKL